MTTWEAIVVGVQTGLLLTIVNTLRNIEKRLESWPHR